MISYTCEDIRESVGLLVNGEFQQRMHGKREAYLGARGDRASRGWQQWGCQTRQRPPTKAASRCSPWPGVYVSERAGLRAATRPGVLRRLPGPGSGGLDT